MIFRRLIFRRLDRELAWSGEAGLGPAGAQALYRPRRAVEEGAHGGTRGSPVREEGAHGGTMGSPVSKELG
jgi:hypothetical protein